MSTVGYRWLDCSRRSDRGDSTKIEMWAEKKGQGGEVGVRARVSFSLPLLPLFLIIFSCSLTLRHTPLSERLYRLIAGSRDWLLPGKQPQLQRQQKRPFKTEFA